MSRFALRFVPLCLVLLSSCYYEHSQTRYIDFESIDKKNVRLAQPVDYYAKKYAGEPAAYECVISTLENSGPTIKANSYVHTTHSKLVILDSNYSKVNDRVTMSYPQWRHLLNFVLLLRDPKGKVQVINKEDLVSSTDKDGQLNYGATLPKMDRGWVREMWVASESNSIIGGEYLAISQPFPCDSLLLRFDCAHGGQLRWKRTIKDVDRLLKKLPTESKDVDVYEYRERDVPASYLENFSDYWSNTARYLQPRYDSDYKGWHQPDRDFYHDYFSNRQPKPEDLKNDTLVTLSKKITANCKSTTQIIDSVLTWVGQNIKIDETEHTTETETITSTLSDNFGTPAMVTSLTRALLEIAGVPSNFVFIRHSGYGPFDTRYIFRWEFDDCGLLVKTEQDSNFVLLPASRTIPYNEYPWYLERTAFQLSSNADSSVFVDLHIDNRVMDKRDETVHITLNTDSSASITIDDDVVGLLAHNVRLNILKAQRFTEREVRDEIIKGLNLPWELSADETNEVRDSVSHLLDYHVPLGLHVQFKVGNIFHLRGIKSPTEPFQRLLHNWWTGDSSLNALPRHNDIRFSSTHDINMHIRVDVPDSWRHTFQNDSLHAESLLGETTLKVDARPDGFNLDRHVKVYGGNYSSTLYKDLYLLRSPYSDANAIHGEIVPRVSTKKTERKK